MTAEKDVGFSPEESVLLSHLKKSFSEAGIPDENLRFEKLTSGFVSIYMCDTLFLKFRITKSSTYFLVKDRFASLFSSDAFTLKKVKSDGLNTRIYVEESCSHDLSDSFKKMIGCFRAGQLFDCCSRYMECSDAKTCTQPDKIHALGCSYRLKLAKGIIFFGKNRNID